MTHADDDDDDDGDGGATTNNITKRSDRATCFQQRT